MARSPLWPTCRMMRELGGELRLIARCHMSLVNTPSRCHMPICRMMRELGGELRLIERFHTSNVTCHMECEPDGELRFTARCGHIENFHGPGHVRIWCII